MSANPNFPNLNSAKAINMWPLMQGQLDEGSLYVATNPTPLTPIATTTSVVNAGNSGATSAQTRPVSVIFNGNAAGSNINLYPLTWNWQVSQVPTSATSWQLALWLEPAGAQAYSTGGSIIIPVPLNPQLSTPTRAQFFFGAITANPTTASGLLIARRQINAAVPVTLDQWTFVFGGLLPSDHLSAGTNPKNSNVALPPVVIPPQWALKVGMFGASNAAAPSWEFECVFAERGAGQ